MARVLEIVTGSHRIDGVVHPVAVWRAEADFLAASTAVLGGGVGHRRWILNASVDADYHHEDPADHLSRIARVQDLDGEGIGLMTAVDVRASHWAGEEGVEALATVGLGWPTWAAAGAES
ncbi:MAG TPA: adenosylcobinamide amidohydrolase, partial [Acidimicrobiales bacterium]